MQPTYDRRTAIKAIGGGLAAVGVSGRVAAGPGRDSAPFDAQRRSVTNATAKYRDIREALADGFEIMGPYVPDMGFHLINFSNIDKARRRGINARQPQGLTYNPAGELGSVEYVVMHDGEAPDVFNDESEDLGTSESAGWHPHHGAQHVFANGNGEQDDREDLSVAELLNNDNWLELSKENPLFPPEQPELEPGDEVTANWGHQPGEDPEPRTVDFLIEHRDWWTLHGWFHFDNPEGLFALFNHNPAWDDFPAPPHH